MIDAQTLARQAGFSKFHQRQLRHLIARLARLAYSDGLEDAACECEWAKPVEPTMDALAAGIRAMKTPNPRMLGEAIAAAVAALEHQPKPAYCCAKCGLAEMHPRERALHQDAKRGNFRQEDDGA